MTALTNIHPADELAALREEIRQLEARESVLRAALLEEGADLRGEQYLAQIVDSSRASLDKVALVEAFGADVIAKFEKKTAFKTVKLKELDPT